MACGHCEARFLVTDGKLRDVFAYTLPSQIESEALLGELTSRLLDSGFQGLPEVTTSTTSLRYLMRRGRVRTRPEVSDSGHKGVAEGFAEVREGLFGLPLDGESELKLLYMVDASDLTKTRAAVPECLEDELLRFDDLIRMAVERDLDERIKIKTAPIQYSWRGFDTHTAWHDDVYILDIPVTEFAFSYPDTKGTVRHVWSGTRPDGQYTASFTHYDGTVLRWEVPRRQANVGAMILIAFAVMFFAPTVLSFLFSVVVFGAMMLFSILAALLGA